MQAVKPQQLARMRDGSTQARFIIESAATGTGRDYGVAVTVTIISISFSCNGASDGVSARASAVCSDLRVSFFERRISRWLFPIGLIANPSDALAFNRLMELFQK